MQTITITDRAMRMIQARATLPFQQTGTRQPDGTWAVPFPEDTIERLQKRTLPGETLGEAIERLLDQVNSLGGH